MKRIFTFLVSAFLFTMVMGQAPKAVILRATTAPIIDGIVDAVWSTAAENPIMVPMSAATVAGVPGVPEVPTTGNSWWKALYDDNGIYLLTFVDDDVFVPAYMGTPVANQGQTWMYDKLEIYFDCNYNLLDGGGPGSPTAALIPGHHQFAPTEREAYVNGGIDSVDATGFSYAFNATDKPKYYVEYFFPFSTLTDKDGIRVDVTGDIGFDVSIQDNDILTIKRDRMDWANDGVIADDWTNMDAAGVITLKDAQAPVQVDNISIGDGAITTDNGTFQMVPVIGPAEATVKILNYSIFGGTGKATISSTGLVTAIKDGTISVRAVATDGGGTESNEAVITISGQVLTIPEVNLIQDGYFSLGKGNLPSAAWQGAAVIVGGIAELKNNWVKVDTIPNPWDWCLTQVTNVPFAEKDLAYNLSFVAWADAERPLTVDFEDSFNGFPRYGVTTDATSPAGTSDWTVTLTTEPVKYVQHVTFTNQVETTVQKFNFMLGMATPKVYLDSVILVKESEVILSAKDLSAKSNSMKVYPNPVGNGTSLFVELASAKTNVAIYNAVGQKLMEKVSTGSRVQFNVSSLQKGLYFVKLSDGTTQKFIK